jgi:hypothetical protein
MRKRHVTNSIAAARDQVDPPAQPAEGYEATIASAIARGGWEIKINTCSMQANVDRACACRSPSLITSSKAPDFSDDEEIGA